MTHPDTQLLSGLARRARRPQANVLNLATGQEIGCAAHAGKAELDQALQAAQKGWFRWRPGAT
jgi:succinate-semialdehyde dehydrogenase/glutarate-semialdehyde dehydrogenase